MSIRTLVLAVAVCLVPVGALADGVKVKRSIDLKELVATSQVIFTATIQEASPKWETREAYGQSQRYASSFHFRLRIDAWLKGRRHELPAWFSLRGDPPPGKWLLVQEAYDPRFLPHDAKPGQRVIVFLAKGDDGVLVESGDGRPELRAREIEDIALLPKVHKALAPAAQDATKPAP